MTLGWPPFGPEVKILLNSLPDRAMTKNKGKRSAKKGDPNRQTGKETKYAYTIKDKVFCELNVLNSANAWWLDRVKVDDVIVVYKMDGTDLEACAYAGVSLEQLKYFKSLHPEFSLVKKLCKQLPTLKARKTINESITTDPNFAFKYLERKRRKEFGQNIDLTSGGKKIDGDKSSLGKSSNEELLALEALRLARRKRIEQESDKKNEEPKKEGDIAGQVNQGDTGVSANMG